MRLVDYQWRMSEIYDIYVRIWDCYSTQEDLNSKIYSLWLKLLTHSYTVRENDNIEETWKVINKFVRENKLYLNMIKMYSTVEKMQVFSEEYVLKNWFKMSDFV